MSRESVSPDLSAHAPLGGRRSQWVALSHRVVAGTVPVKVAGRDQHCAIGFRSRQQRRGHGGPVATPTVIRGARRIVKNRRPRNKALQNVWISCIGLKPLDARIIGGAASTWYDTHLLTPLGPPRCRG